MAIWGGREGGYERRTREGGRRVREENEEMKKREYRRDMWGSETGKDRIGDDRCMEDVKMKMLIVQDMFSPAQ